MGFLFPKAFVFDWDNTLVDSWPAIGEAINHTRAHFGLPTWNPEEIKANCTRAARDSFPEWFGTNWEKAYEIYYRDFDKVRRTRPIKVKNGAFEFLQWLKSLGIPCFVVSNKRGDYLRHEADKLGWNDYFMALVGAQDAPKDKPAREHVDFALKHADIVSDESVWFVGDSEIDMLCARNADCTPVYIGAREEAQKLSVSLVFDDCQGLHGLLSTEFSKTKVR